MKCGRQRHVGNVTRSIVRNSSDPRLPRRFGKNCAFSPTGAKDVRELTTLAAFIPNIFRNVGKCRDKIGSILRAPILGRITSIIELGGAHHHRAPWRVETAYRLSMTYARSVRAFGTRCPR